MLCECGVTYCYILVPFWCVWSGWQCFCFILLLFPAPSPHFPAQFREWGKQKVILFLSMSIITQYVRRGQIYYPARKNMLGGGRGGTGVLSMFLFSNQIIKLHTHTTCPLHHTILILFKVEGGGGWGREVFALSLSHRHSQILSGQCSNVNQPIFEEREVC